MKPQHKKKWVKALRSGQYVQGQGALCQAEDGNTHAFCCLGVLVNETTGFDFTPEESEHSDFAEVGYGESGTLTPELMRMYGLKVSEVEHLIDLNDTMKELFDEIADYIEEKL